MIALCRLFLILVLLFELLDFSTCFSVSTRSSVPSLSSSRSLTINPLFAKSHPEFTVVDEDQEDDGEDELVNLDESNDVFVVNADALQNTQKDQITSERNEFGALSPGTVVQVQVGDLALARKAWKKRRRSGSPLLIPCSVLNVDRQSMVRWNLIFLLEKFGQSRKDGIEISLTEISKKYRSYLKSSLQKQTLALGYESSHEMIVALFNKKTQEFYGIRLIEEEGGSLSLKAPIARHKAQKRAAAASLLEFRLHRNGDYGDADTMTHTGFVKTRTESDDNEYHFLPLSAALRVSQKDDVDTGRVQEGSIHPAVVFDYDVAGDGGSPLLTLSLNPRGVRETLKVKPDRKFEPLDDPKHMLQELKVGDGPFSAKVVRLQRGKALVDFKVGRKVSSSGIVKVLGSLYFRDSIEVPDEKSHTMDEWQSVSDDGTDALIEAALGQWDDDHDDMDDTGEGLIEDLLSLTDESSFEEGTFEEDEEEEDISDLFNLNEDGSLSYTDPETGETAVLDVDGEDSEELMSEEEEHIPDLFNLNDDGSLLYTDPETGETAILDVDDEDFELMMMVKSQIDTHSSPVKSAKSNQNDKNDKQKDSPSPLHASHQTSRSSKPAKIVSKKLRVGDDVDVYIRSISKQSCQFSVTTDPMVQGRKAKDIKKETDAHKKLKRLQKSLGGSLKKIWDLEGKECDGTVKATSKTGDWLYVQPNLKGLPVGIASLNNEFKGISAGDSVRVRIAGVDEERGQLALQVLNKLAP